MMWMLSASSRSRCVSFLEVIRYSNPLSAFLSPKSGNPGSGPGQAFGGKCSKRGLLMALVHRKLKLLLSSAGLPLMKVKRRQPLGQIRWRAAEKGPAGCAIAALSGAASDAFRTAQAARGIDRTRGQAVPRKAHFDDQRSRQGGQYVGRHAVQDREWRYFSFAQFPPGPVARPPCAGDGLL